MDNLEEQTVSAEFGLSDPAQKKGPGITRRRFLQAGCALMAGGIATAASGALYSTRLEPSWIEIVEVNVRLPGLPPALDSLTIAQLSDLHLGPHVSARDIARAVEMTNALEADLIVVTGDYVYESAAYSAPCAQELAALRAPHGTFAVLGNHDIWTGAEQVAANLSASGMDVLRNRALPLTVQGATLWLVGVEDTGLLAASFGDFRALWQPAADALARLLEAIPPDDARILLVHNPDFTEMLPEARVDLALCGHTHGGQVRLPLLGAPIVPSCFGQKYAGGLVAGPQTTVYVNRGIGVIAPPVRFNCRPEITLLRLKSA